MKTFTYILTFIVAFVLGIFITNGLKQVKTEYIKGKTDTTYVKGKDTTITFWRDNIIHDTVFVADTTHTSDFALQADSATCKGKVQFILEGNKFSFYGASITYPRITKYRVDTLKLSRVDTLKLLTVPRSNWYDRFGVYIGVGTSHELKPVINLSFGYKIW